MREIPCLKARFFGKLDHLKGWFFTWLLHLEGLLKIMTEPR